VRNNNGEIGVRLSGDVVQRLQLESARRGEFIRDIVMEALEAYLPKVKVTVIKPGRSRASIAQEA
jgi:hypothetical protein